MATKKVLTIDEYPYRLECIRHNDAAVNPYRLYILYPGTDRYGYPTMHRRKLTEYADTASVICHIKDLYLRGCFPYRKIENILAWNKQYCRI